MIVPILVLVAIYRVPDFVSGVMANPLYIDLGFSKTAIATVSKLYGVWIGIAGVFAGGVAVLRLGLMPALLIGGIAASASHLALPGSRSGVARLDLLTVAIGVEGFASGFAGTALIAFMSSLTSPALRGRAICAFELALCAAGQARRRILGAHGRPFGYPAFFVITSAIGIPGRAPVPLCWRRTLAGRTEAEALWPRPAQAREATLALLNRIR